ncbi:MAG TPA: hypothetical protein VGB55_00805 [Tepidisphaeraceae bacterium]|jgi:hypothetical protein
MAFAFGCDHSDDVTQPATQQSMATTTSSTKASLKPIELRYGIYLARLDHRIAVSTDGTLRSVQTTNKSYGGNDIDPKNERVEVREGKLSTEEVIDLARLFADWDSLSKTPYSGVPDGGDISIRYGDRTVTGGSEVPQQVTDIHHRLMELARSMPVVKP